MCLPCPASVETDDLYASRCKPRMMFSWGHRQFLPLLVTFVLIGASAAATDIPVTPFSSLERTLNSRHEVQTSIPLQSDLESDPSTGLGGSWARVGRLFQQNGENGKDLISDSAMLSVTDTRNIFSCMSDGAWVKFDTPRKLPWSNTFEDGISSSCDHLLVHQKRGIAFEDADRTAENGNCDAWNVRAALKWEWQARATCHYERFNRNNMCKILDAMGNVLFVGDSMQGQFARTFLNHMRLNESDNDPPVVGPPQVCICPSVCVKRYYPDAPITFCHKFLSEESEKQNRPMRSLEQRSKVRYVINDHLSTSSINDVTGRSCAWIQRIKEWDIKVLVLNRGAHFVEDNIFERELRHTLGVVKKSFPHLLVIYRNTPAGHKGCTNNSDPNFKGHTTSTYHNWERFALQNEISRKIVKEYGFIYFDVATPMLTRSDGHVGYKFSKVTSTVHPILDCLHYCLPGPVDLWVEFLYNILLQVVPVSSL